METSIKLKLLRRLEKGKRIHPNGCWTFHGPSGVQKKEIYVGDRNQLVHRISMMVFRDFNIHDHALICHKCKTKYCWNPDHLYIGNTTTNTLDAIKDGTFKNRNMGKTHCVYGHELSGINLYTWKDKRTGQIHRWCRICRETHSNNYKAKIAETNYGDFKKVKLS